MQNKLLQYISIAIATSVPLALVIHSTGMFPDLVFATPLICICFAAFAPQLVKQVREHSSLLAVLCMIVLFVVRNYYVTSDYAGKPPQAGARLFYFPALIAIPILAMSSVEIFYYRKQNKYLPPSIRHSLKHFSLDAMHTFFVTALFAWYFGRFSFKAATIGFLLISTVCVSVACIIGIFPCIAVARSDYEQSLISKSSKC